MRAPLSWIRDFTPIEAEADVIGNALDNLGLEVEEIVSPGAEIGGVVAARIVEVLPHPNADKLQLADVDTGDGVVRVVCGAPNIRAGMVVPLATVGGHLPGGMEIAKRKIRGETSLGMLCSARELGLGDDHAGILAIREALDDEAKPGEAVDALLSGRSLILTGLSIGLDELAVGFSLGVLGVSLGFALAYIAVQAFVLTLVGLFLGEHVGARLSDRAELMSGIGLCLLAVALFVNEATGAGFL